MVKRVLSEDEKTLWRSVARTAKPLRRRKVTDLEEGQAPATSTPAARRASRAAPVPPVAAQPAKSAPPPLAPIGRRDKSRLAKGRHVIDARLDLHGMTQARAHQRLIAFLQQAHVDGCAFVLVITGKGKASAASDGERGILRRQVPLWLDLPDLRRLVVGFEQAHLAHGGEGALYVRLRRAR